MKHVKRVVPSEESGLIKLPNITKGYMVEPELDPVLPLEKHLIRCLTHKVSSTDSFMQYVVIFAEYLKDASFLIQKKYPWYSSTFISVPHGREKWKGAYDLKQKDTYNTQDYAATSQFHL